MATSHRAPCTDNSPVLRCLPPSCVRLVE
uniref:Uncharacterized protein n=1 Tax=Arundo donax TaxID=35708 RepID=A0A0A9A1S7_ARUDO